MTLRAPAGWLCAALALCLSLPACGGASRAVFAQSRLAETYQDPKAARQLLGVEPTLPVLWLESARIATLTSQEDALDRVREGLSFQPDDPGLKLARVELLEVLGRHAESLAAALHAEASLPLQSIRMALIHAELRNRLALGQVDQAEHDARRLAGLVGGTLPAEADAFARVALELAILGRLEDADAAMDRSLSRGPGGLAVLMGESLQRPEALAAARTLRRRAAQRHPGDPDLAITLVVDLMDQDKLPEAQAALETLPAPLPVRLESDALALRARLFILQGQHDAGLVLILSRLDEFPGDRSALMVLEECWVNHGMPSNDEFMRRLWLARDHVSRQMRQRLEAVLADLQKRGRPVGPPAPQD